MKLDYEIIERIIEVRNNLKELEKEYDKCNNDHDRDDVVIDHAIEEAVLSTLRWVMGEN